jgi:mannosyl-3-phosphoglycerate phosphatase
MADRRYILFSDLDGTLLDARTYGFDEARPALEAIRSRGIPLIVMTSKTAEETVPYVRAIGPGESYSTENGGAAYLAARQAALPPAGSVREGDYYRFDLGAPAARLIEFLAAFNLRRGAAIQTLRDLTVRQVAALTGLPEEAAGLARLRRFDLPLILPEAGEGLLDDLRAEAGRAGWSVVGGGRFPHLKGRADKGTAFDLLAPFYRTEKESRTVALGDSANDLPMLARADLAVLIPRPDGSLDPGLAEALPAALRAPCPGPEGWAAALLDVFHHGR